MHTVSELPYNGAMYRRFGLLYTAFSLLVLIVLVSGFGFSYLLGRKRFQPVGREDSLDRRRQRLLVEIAQLDDDFEDGKISEEVYRRMRSSC